MKQDDNKTDDLDIEASRLVSVWAVMSDNGGAHFADNLHSLWTSEKSAMDEAIRLNEKYGRHGIEEVKLNSQNEDSIDFSISADVEDERGNAVAHSDLLGGSFLFGQNPLPEARIIIHCFPSPVGYGKVSKESAAIHGSLNSSCSLIDYTRVDKPLNLGHLQAQIESSHSAPEVRPDKTFFCFGDGLYDFLFGEPVGSLLPFLLDHTPDTNGNMHYADGKKWDSEKSEKISVFFLFAPNWKEIENCAGNESYVSVPRGRFYEVYESLWVEHFLSPNTNVRCGD